MRYRSTARPWARGGGWARSAPCRSARAAGSATPTRTPSSPATGSTCSCAGRAGSRTSHGPTTACTGAGRARSCARPSARPRGRSGPTRSTPPAPDGSILMLFSDGHPASWRSGLYFARFADGRFLSAAGEVLGDLDDGPPAVTDLERIHAPRDGRAWPMDIARGTRRRPGRRLHEPARRGRHVPLCPVRRRRVGDPPHRGGRANALRLPQRRRHARPRRPLARGAQPDHRRAERDRAAHARTTAAAPGRHSALTHDSEQFNVRPVIPRERRRRRPGLVLFVTGSATSYRRYDTAVVIRRDPGLR